MNAESMIATETVFLDTNIFVCAFLTSEPDKRAKAIALPEACLESGRGCTSYQVVQEFANVAVKKFATPLSADSCKAFINAAMQPLNRVASSTRLVYTALELQAALKFSFYDCLVLAAALEAGATTLVTEDFQPGQQVQYAGKVLRIVNPFMETV